MYSMNRKIMSLKVTKYNANENIFVADEKFVASEEIFELRLNGEFFRKIFCSPSDLEDLTVGILAQAEKIFSVEDIAHLEINDSLIDVVIKPDINPVQIKFSNDVKFVAKELLASADKLLGELSTTHDKTNGVHSGILFDGKKILILREDIGRHNVLDKIHGAAIREKIFLGDKILIFSGRCSSEMVIKLANMKIPVVLAKSVPTTHAINLAKKFDITLAGRLRVDSFCIYTNPQRIVLS